MQLLLLTEWLPLPVPSTAIYSRSDAVVPANIAQEPEHENSENIEVIGSHVGLVVNPQVIFTIARRLALDPTQKLRS